MSIEYKISAAASTNIGRIREKNEDNLLFEGRTLPCDHKSLHYPYKAEFPLDEIRLFGIFDGLGGEPCGEIASYTAAISFKEEYERRRDLIENTSDLLKGLCEEANRAVVLETQVQDIEAMGTTVSGLLFKEDSVYVCNIGDSRAFRLRDSEFLQLSEDHVERLSREETETRRKPRITQYIGIPENELKLEPYIAKGTIRSGDQYLICSDGLTDMVSNIEICTIMKNTEQTAECVDKLIKEALERGGRDNVSVILCRVE